MTQEKLNIRITECANGFIVYSGSRFTEENTEFFATRQELADYICPRPEPTEYDLAYNTHLQEVASTSKPEIQASDFLKAEAEKAQYNDKKLRIFIIQAQAHGYEGRLQDYIAALKAAKAYLNSQNADNLQDDGK